MVKVNVAEAPPLQLKPARGSVLEELDLDGDGDIDVEDLHRLVNLKRQQERLIRMQKLGMLAMTLIVVGVGVGLGLELKAAKEETNAAIEKARVGGTQAHKEVPSGLQVDMKVASADRRGRRAEVATAASVDLTDKEGNAIRSDRSLDKLKMTSELPNSAFAELERIQIEGPSGEINFKTQGFARYNAPDSRCGSVVVVYTTMGYVQFDGTAMLFDEEVAGAFGKAGFEVSGSRTRARRTRMSRSRRQTEMDENNYSLIGVNRMFGEFSFIDKVDLSGLSCGDERPTLRSPFDANVNDIQVEEDSLYSCQDDAGPESRCPTTTALIEGLNGMTYFKRSTKMRAKKINGVWRTIRSTTFPDLNADSAVAAEYVNGEFVELSAGSLGQAYQYWPNHLPPATDSSESVSSEKVERPPFYTHCQDVKTVDHTKGIEANDEDITDEEYDIEFVGYDVFNNHYVKHFRVYDLNPDDGPNTIDYLESFEEDRMYAVQLLKGYWTTYESIKTNGDVDPDFLQSEAYPDIDGKDFGAANGVKCADETLWASIDTKDADHMASYTDADIATFRQERTEDAERPDLERFLSVAWDFATYETRCKVQKAIGDELITNLFPAEHNERLVRTRYSRDVNDIDIDEIVLSQVGDTEMVTENPKTLQRTRRCDCLTAETSFSYKPMGANPYFELKGGLCPWSAPGARDPQGPYGYLTAEVGGYISILSGHVTITATGSLSIYVQPQHPFFAFVGTASIKLKVGGTTIALTVTGTYYAKLGGAKHVVELEGSIYVQLGCRRQRRDGPEVIEAEPIKQHESNPEARELLGRRDDTRDDRDDTRDDTSVARRKPLWGPVKKAVAYVAKAIVCNFTPKITAALTFIYEEATVAMLANSVPKKPKGVTLTVSLQIFVFTGEITIPLRA